MNLPKHNTIARNITTCDRIIASQLTMLNQHMKKSDLSKTYRVRGEFTEKVKSLSLDFIIETKERIEEADIINALLYKHLGDIKAKDVTKYIEEVKKGE